MDRIERKLLQRNIEMGGVSEVDNRWYRRTDRGAEAVELKDEECGCGGDEGCFYCDGSGFNERWVTRAIPE